MTVDKKNADPNNTVKNIAKNLRETINSTNKELTEGGADASLAAGKIYALGAYHEEAIACFHDALKASAKLHEAAARLGILQIRTGRNLEALKTLSELAKRAPDYAMPEMASDEVVSVYTLLGNALLVNRRYDQAIAAYEKAGEVCPRDTSAAARLAQLHIASGNQDAAVELAPRFADNPRFASLSATLFLTRDSKLTLPAIGIDAFIASAALDVHGRPVIVNESARVAALVTGDDSWCADVLEVGADEPA